MNHSERGITLVEILVALFILSVGLVSLLIVVPVAALGIQSGNELSAATYLAQQRLEQARNAAWTAAPAVDCLGASPASLDSAPVPSGATCNGATAATFPDEALGTIPGAGRYSRVTRIAACNLNPAECSGLANNTLRLVRVTVSYRPMTGTGVSASDTNVTLEWLVAQR